MCCINFIKLKFIKKQEANGLFNNLVIKKLLSATPLSANLLSATPLCKIPVLTDILF